MSGSETDTAVHDWTKSNTQKLLAAIKTSIPEEEKKSVYSKGLKAVNWSKVAFPPFSPEECQKKWTEILRRIPKFRTLTELIVEAEDNISNPVQNNTVNTAQRSFVSVTFSLKCGERQALINEFKKKSTHIKQSKKKKKKKATQGLPAKPPISGYNLFCREELLPAEEVSKKARVLLWAQRWRELSESQKKEYSRRCKDLKREYSVQLRDYLMTLNAEEQQQAQKKLGIKNSRALKKLAKTFPGEPKMPTRNGNTIFCKEKMETLKEKIPNLNERFRKISQKWSMLSNMEKERYKKKVNENFRKYSMELQKWFKTLMPSEQIKYRKQNPRKCQYLNFKLMEAPDMDKILSGPSDSEDEDIEDSSSDEEDDLGWTEDGEEEEEEDYMFEMF